MPGSVDESLEDLALLLDEEEEKKNNCPYILGMKGRIILYETESFQ
jgi:hypothetical protein